MARKKKNEILDEVEDPVVNDESAEDQEEGDDDPVLPKKSDKLKAAQETAALLRAALEELAELRGKVAKLTENGDKPLTAEKSLEAFGFIPFDGVCPEGAKLKKVRVTLPHSKTLDVELPYVPGMELGFIRQAEATYNKFFNIIGTVHRHEVVDV